MPRYRNWSRYLDGNGLPAMVGLYTLRNCSKLYRPKGSYPLIHRLCRNGLMHREPTTKTTDLILNELPFLKRLMDGPGTLSRQMLCGYPSITK